ncbi:Brix-domain-containing protein [Conidiobolus coronatus NRRL 28638]|uniref:Brix-domain-containing protein n=1 Tax=Conidiobolus coronatus (strain ATCC 28846 / CBS 209.66 / NRRL 28638) TaxID=796925 RepID=A0A137NV51_CONC2|nr:Brix-domain-containing protein [Conidiobolus coronatus NRRL 28638]|eukprot:KXN66660.1 Brix-domain-containing protein [Conidiobolus coronatus NRRL 28638]
MASLFKKQLKKQNLRKKKVDDELSDEEEEIQEIAAPTEKLIYKQRVLILCSRGITFRHRHLMNDLEALMPHAKKDSKLDSKQNLGLLNELAEMNNCNNCLYFEARKGTDLYLWISKTPNGPSAKFHIQNIHTMSELKMTGNCLKGSRPLLSFDALFDSAPHYKVLKEMFVQTFGVPKTSRKLKPFIDRIYSFSIVDNRVWFRHYQIVENDPTEQARTGKKTTLVEIGPRFCMNLIRIFEGSFRGTTLYDNPLYVSPNMVRASLRKESIKKYQNRKNAEASREEYLKQNPIPKGKFEGAFA